MRFLRSTVIGFVVATTVAACDGRYLSPIAMMDTPSPVTAEEAALARWTEPTALQVTLLDFVMAPDRPIFRVGESYRLEIRNVSESEQIFAAKAFFDTAVVRSLEVSPIELHRGPHADEPIAGYDEFPTGLDAPAPAVEAEQQPAPEAKPADTEASGSDVPAETESPPTDLLRPATIRVPPAHAARLDLVPLRAGTFPLRGAFPLSPGTRIVVEPAS
jgi:hypothetical protein